MVKTESENIGALLAIISAIVSNLGINVQKYSHILDEKLDEENQRPYYKRKYWWIGLICIVAGSVGDFVAFGFATQALVASLGGGTTMVANVIIAHFFNQEVLYKTDIIGVGFTILGTFIIAMETDPDTTDSLEELEKRFLRPTFIVYLCIVILCTVSLLATIKGSLANKLKNQLRFSKDRQKRLMHLFEVRFQQMEDRIEFLEMSLVGDPSKKGYALKSPSNQNSQKRRVKKMKLDNVNDIMDGLASRDHVPYYYAICAGVVGAISVLLAKCLALMVTLTMQGENEFLHPFTYAFLGGMLVTILVQTHLLNMATILGDTMTVFPIFQAFWISFSVIGGIVLYESEKGFTLAKWILYPFALLCVAIGVLFLIQHEEKKRCAGETKYKKQSALDQQQLLYPIDDVHELLDGQEPLRMRLLG